MDARETDAAEKPQGERHDEAVCERGEREAGSRPEQRAAHI